MAGEERTPTGVGKTLRDVLKRIDSDQRLEAFEVWNFWDDAVGAALARRARPSGCRNGVLIVTVSAHVWMQELQFMKDDLRRSLNARLGKDLIRDIHLVAGAVDSAPPTAGSADDTTARLAPMPLPAIADPQLAAAFQRLVRAHARRRRTPPA
jgi:predicted nucleic acid-binding Zn ribbon protein